jgi:hypothetical protein
VIVFAVGSTDRIFFRLHISYTGQIHFWRAGIWVLPAVVFAATRSVCRSLQRSGSHPLRLWQGSVVKRRSDGSIEWVGESPDQLEAARSEPPSGSPP